MSILFSFSALLLLFVHQVPVVLSASPQEIAHGWYLAESGRTEDAAHIAVRALNENPDDLGAHQLYVRTVVSVLEDDQALVRQYRARVAEQPNDAVARVALALALTTTNPHPGLWCQEFLTALETVPNDTGLRYWVYRLRYEARERCATKVEADRAALIELAELTPTALGYSLRLRIEEGNIDEHMVAELGSFYDAEPWNLNMVGNLWARELKGAGLKQARADALAAAEQALDSQEPSVAASAFRVFQHAENDPGRVKAELRRAELDPQWRTSDRSWSGERLSLTEGGAQSTLERDIEQARRKSTPAAARQALNLLDKRVPPKGPLRAMWLKELGMIQLREGKGDEAFATFRAAWQMDASIPSVANAFAYSAALRGQDLDLALVAVDTVIKRFPMYDPWKDYGHQGYEAWAEKTANQTAARMDTQAWILSQLGKTEDAAAILQRALLLTRDPDPILHHHLGFVLAAMGREDAALEQFGIGLSMGPSDEDDLDRRARAAAEKLFNGRRWSHRGFEGWLQARTHPDPTALACACVGLPFPNFPFKVGGADKSLADYPGVRLVVMWNGQSLSFQKQLPYIEEISKKYAPLGLRVLALGVDARPEEVEAFWQGSPATGFVVGWGGLRAREALHLKRIPSAYIVDGEGLVRGIFTGHGGRDDHRVELRLEEVLKGRR